MVTIISLFEMFNVIVPEAKSKGWPDPNIFLRTAAPVADAAAADPNGKKTILANIFINFLLKASQILPIV